MYTWLVARITFEVLCMRLAQGEVELEQAIWEVSDAIYLESKI